MLLENFRRLLADFVHEGDGEIDPYAVHRFEIGGDLFVTVPWFKNSTSCPAGELRKRLDDESPILIPEPTFEHYLLVTDELSETAWAVSLGDSPESEDLLLGIDRTVQAIDSTQYDGLPCWVAEVREVGSPVFSCIVDDTASDATVRLGLAYYNAANNPYFSTAGRAYFRMRADTIAALHLEEEYLHETHTSGVTDRTMDHWAAAGGNTSQALSGSEMYIGYYQDIALFLLAAYVATAAPEYLDRAEDVVDQWATANSFDGSALAFGPKRFGWAVGMDGKLRPAEIAPWDESDAPRALWMGHVLRAHQLATDGAPFPAPYAALSDWVELLLASDSQNPTHSCIEYFPDGTPKANCGGNYYYHGLSMGLLTFHRTSWLPIKLDATLNGSYSWSTTDNLYWDWTPCFGVYRPVRPLKALASALGFDASTYGGGARSIQHLLTVARTGVGTGFVEVDSAGLDCGSRCVGVVEDGGSVTLEATPYLGSSFGGWSEPGCASAPFQPAGDTTCTALFDGVCSLVADFQAETVDDARTFAGCEEVRAGNGFRVVAGGSAILRAGGRIVLYDGFSVETGGSLVARVDAEP